MSRKFFIETYGCQMNTAESEALKNELRSSGWTEAEYDKEAQLIVINTCSVRQSAENRIWGRLGYFKSLSEQHEFRLVIIGCMAERLKDELKKKFPVVSDVIDNEHKNKAARILSGTEDDSTSDLTEDYSFFEKYGKVSSTHAMVPVMNGCDNFCSYCIVPYVRGRETSRNDDEIIKEIRQLTAEGVSEITLLGQNVNSFRYRKDSFEINFSALIRRILNDTDVKWLRFTSSNPQDFSDELIELYASEDRLCKYLHLPAQHGSDNVLKNMNRKYTVEQYRTIIRKLRSKITDLSLSTDIMVGFPGETEEDFNKLKDFMNEMRFEDAFTYYYNPREGTAAYKMTDDVPHDVKSKRLSEIIEIHRTTSTDVKLKRIGQETTAVVESISKKDDKMLLGRTDKNSMIVFPGGVDLLNRYVNLSISGLKGSTYTGGLINV